MTINITNSIYKDKNYGRLSTVLVSDQRSLIDQSKGKVDFVDVKRSLHENFK